MLEGHLGGGEFINACMEPVDDGTEKISEQMKAIVDVWQANTGGTYSWFDASQSEFNLRRRIETDAQGNYRFRSIVPSGYGCPPTGPTQQLLDQLGRHGQRPAHIH